MKTIIHEIRKQPHHVRELATILCTIAVAALVGIIWFNSFQKNLYTMLNPIQAQPEKLAQSQSLFGSIWSAILNGQAEISSLFHNGNTTTVSQPETQPAVAHPLPVTGDK